MRVLVLALAILLLPLRGWLGDGMSTAAAIEAAQPVAAHATHTMHAGDPAMHDMAGMSHDGHAAHDGHGARQASHHGEGSCGDCQLCHSVALTLWPEPAAPIEAPRTAPAFAPAAFASAEPAPGFKPPIS